MSDAVLNDLAAVLEARKAAEPEGSYVAGLYAAGLARALGAGRVVHDPGREAGRRDAHRAGNRGSVVS